MPFTIHLQGNEVRGTTQRAVLLPDAPGFSGTFTVVGGDAVEHSSNADGSSGTSVASGATSGAITVLKYLRSVGKSTVRCDNCRIEGQIL